MAGARIGFLAGPRALMRGCLQLKAALTRLNTNPISQRGALAALRDEAYLASAQATIRANLAHLEETLAGVDGVELAVRPERGLACAIDVSGSGASAQEVMVALFARRDRRLPGRRPRRGGGREHGPAEPVQPRALGRWSTCAPSLGEARRRGGERPLARARRGAARRQGHRPRGPVGRADPGWKTRTQHRGGERLMTERLIVIGGGGAGTSAATIAKRVNPDLKVSLFTEFEDIAYSPCGIPFVHGREIPSFEDLFLSTVERYVDDGLDMRMETVGHRHRPRPRHRHRAQPARGLRQADRRHRLHCGRSPTSRARTSRACTTSRTSARRWSSTSCSTP